MQNRKAIILSLGMLMQRIDLSCFIDMMTVFGQTENQDFLLTSEMMGKGAALANQFNLGQIEPDKFADAIMQLLNIKSLEATKFWQAWNNMIQVGDLTEKITLLQSAAQLSRASFYLYSATNRPHLAFIEQQSGDAVVQPTTDKSQPATFHNMPLYASCLLKKQTSELIKLIVTDIKQKQNNVPDEIILVLANPGKIENPALRAEAEKQVYALTAWCDANKVKVVSHDFNLRETLLEIAVDDVLAPIQTAPSII